MQSIPLCPITGLPARRRIQPISARLISELWRGAFGVKTERQLAGIEHFGLWESPCGLAFFEPMLAGDEAFYLDLYRQGDFHRLLTAPGLARGEFKRDRRTGPAGGQGPRCRLRRRRAGAPFAAGDLCRSRPEFFAAAAGGPDIRNETIAEHAALHPAEYDLVCAFHVIEHVADPLGFARDLVRCLRPGGRLCIAVPGRCFADHRDPEFRAQCARLII